MKRNFNEIPRNPAVTLCSIKTIVEYSFIVQKSLTYLDLSLCEFSKVKRKVKRNESFYTFLSDLKIDHTEESCRKRIAHQRDLLYKLHLDVSKDLELNLRNIEPQKLRPCYSRNILLNEVVIHPKKCECYLNTLIAENLEYTNQKVKLILQVSKMAKNVEFISKEEWFIYICLNFLFSEGADSTTVNEFLTGMNFNHDYLIFLPSNVFEFVLYHANFTGYSLWSHPSYEDPILALIAFGMFGKIESLLQYRSAPRFCYNDLEADLKKQIRFVFPTDILEVAVEAGLITRRRGFLILLNVYCHWRDGLHGLKALRMMWWSIPDPFITPSELTSVFSMRSLLNEGDIISFINDIRGPDSMEERCVPRKLKHFCRITIRNILSISGQLPTVIAELKLPPSLKSFLKLEN